MYVKLSESTTGEKWVNKSSSDPVEWGWEVGDECSNCCSEFFYPSDAAIGTSSTR
jgi:hypothetical protein